MSYPKKTVHKATSTFDPNTNTNDKYAGTRCGGYVGGDLYNKSSTKWGRVTCKECLATKQRRFTNVAQ